MSDDERLPEPQPGGALVPPPSYPHTALATASPLSPRRWDHDVDVARGLFDRVLRSTLDALDDAGDRIATAMGLR
jgi:hypothetical protein